MTALAETIAAQGEVLESVLALDLGDAVARLRGARRVCFVGTGTSQHAAELGALMFEPGDIQARWSSSASFTVSARALNADDAVVVISHTTETAFARRAREHALNSGARVTSITGPERGWPEAVQTPVRERSETYTTSYIAALLVLARLGVALGQSSFAGGQLSEIPDRVRAAIASPRVLDTAPERLLVLAGVGPGAITAREGALKLREAARLPAEGYEAEYLLHGSAVPLRRGDALIAVQPAGDESGLLAGLAAAATSEGLRVASVQEPAGLHPILTQIPLTVRLQKLASELADARGVDPDVVIEGSWAEDGLWDAGAPS
jgi:glucosamine--fructose-6-phosphate aminotransferase (isomerizing)